MAYQTTTAGLSWSRTLSSPTYFLSSPTPGQAQPEPSPTPSAAPTPSPSITPSATPSFSPTPSPVTESNPAAYLYLQPSEIQACPDTGEQEWLELYNPTDYPLNLGEWHVKDSAENLRVVSGSIAPHAFGSLGWSSGLLNNTGDTLSLISPDNDSLFTATFGPCTKNTSYILDNSEWKLTTSITKNQTNSLTTASPTPTLQSIAIKTSPAPKTQKVSSDTSATAVSQETPKAKTLAQTLPPLSTALKSLVATQTATTSYKVAAIINHPFASPSATVNLEQPVPNAPAIMSVIMGGTVLMATHGLKLYRLYHHVRASDTTIPPQPPRILFP